MKNADTAISQPVTIEKRERKEGDREESEESGGTFDVKREELKEGVSCYLNSFIFGKNLNSRCGVLL